MIDPETIKLVQGAARTFEGLDTLPPLNFDRRVIEGAAATFNNFDTMKLVDMTAVRDVAKSFEAIRPIVAPQIAEVLAVAADAGATSVFADAHKKLALDFGKAFTGLDIGAVIQPRLAESLQALKLPTTFTERLVGAMRDSHRIAAAELAPGQLGKTADDAVVLAEVDEVAEVVDEAVGRFQDMSSGERRMLALEVTVLIAAFLVVAAWLAESPDPKDPRGAGLALACAAALMRVYWRLTGKLD